MCIRDRLVGFGPVQIRVLELKLARANPDVVPLLLLGVEAAEAMHDQRALDGKAEGVLRGKRECLAGVGHRGHGDAADGVRHGMRKQKCLRQSLKSTRDDPTCW